MRKAFLLAPHQLRIDEVPDPVPGPRGVLVRIEHASLCVSDVGRYEGDGFTGTPRGLGHDAAGIVERVGERVTRVAVGDAVTLTGAAPCGQCRRCVAGRPSGCTRRSLQPPADAGWFAEKTLIPERNVVPLLPGVTTEDGALMETAYTGVHGARLLGFGPGELVPVFGAGWMSWGQIAAARLAGARPVALATNPLRLAMAERFGAVATLSPADPDLGAKLRAMNHGEPPFYVIDATGGHDAGALPLVQQLAGEGAIIGLLARKEGVPLIDFMRKGQTLVAIGSGSDKRVAIDLIAQGQLDFKPCISHRFPFEQLDDAFQLMLHPTPDLSKIMIDMG